MYKDNLNEERQVFDVLAVPCDRRFVVAPEKTEKFKDLKSNYELREKNIKFLERVKNIKIELNNHDKVLIKTK